MSTATATSPLPRVPKIGTHSGTFHCDEALACYLLRLTPTYRNWDVVRSRDPEVLNQLPILVDVGSEYVPEKGRYDHHQRGFEETLTPKHKIKLSSAGLIYKHFGREILQSLTQVSGDDLEKLYFKVYDDFVAALDGIDNGISQYPQGTPSNYRVTTDLSSRVGFLNPHDDEKDVDVQTRFYQAMEMAGSEFVYSVKHAARYWLPSRKGVKDAIAERFNVHASGQIIRLDAFCAWKSHIYDVEEEMKVQKPILYVLFCDSSSQWRIQAVGASSGSFASRKALPEPWRGIRDEELVRVSGIPGCVFCHHSGFIGGNLTYEGVLQMAVKAVEM